MKFSAVNLPRVLRKFESFSGTNAWVSPLVDFEYESTQDLLTPVSGVIGTDFGFDLLGEAEAPLDFGEERLRFSIVAKCSPTEIDDEFQRMTYRLRKIGRGWGYTVDSLGVKYKAQLRLTSMPTYSVANVSDPSAAQVLNVVAVFRRYTRWFRYTDFSNTQAITTSPTSYSISVPGNDTCKRLIIRFRANASANFSAWKLENLTTGQEFSCTYVMNTANKEVKLNTKEPSIEYTDDDGTSYNDAWSYYVLPTSNTQKILTFDLVPGTNNLRFSGTGTIRVNVEISSAEIVML